jgi:hypothetical protein
VSNFTVAVKLLVVFGLLALLVGQMLGGPNPFDDLSETLTQGIDFPEFDNPFTEETILLTSFIGSPVEGDATDDSDFGGVSFHGCENVTLRRGECMGRQDRDDAFVRLTVRDDFSKSGFTWNYSNSEYKNIENTTLRSVKITIQCRTEVNATAELTFRLWWSMAGFSLKNYPLLVCPKSSSYQTVTWTNGFPNGITYDPFTTPCAVFPPCIGTTQQAWIFTAINMQTDPEVNNTPGASARFTYFRIDVEVSAESTCVPPEGAWFPALDAVACAIFSFANLVWRIGEFLINGISFIVVTIGVVLIFLGQVVFGMLLGIIEMATWFLTIDAPDIVKAIFGVFTVAAIAFPILTVAGLIRGTGP